MFQVNKLAKINKRDHTEEALPDVLGNSCFDKFENFTGKRRWRRLASFQKRFFDRDLY